MRCHCYETKTEFVFCVEDVDKIYEDSVLAAWFRKDDDRFIKTYPNDIDDKELIKRNFNRLGESMFIGAGDWQDSLFTFASRCGQEIEWYVTGSASEAITGANIKPHDLDLVVHTRDYYRAKELFTDYLVEPFLDYRGTWVLQYFGRLCIDGFMVDVVADEKLNKENHEYDYIIWKGYPIRIEPLKVRYATELQRNRKDRIEAIQEYMSRQTM